MSGIEAPLPIMTVLDRAIDALLIDSRGVFKLPAGGYLAVTWQNRKGCYRLTIDVLPDYWPDGLDKGSPRMVTPA